MGFGGSVQGMIVSLRNNKRERKTLFDKEHSKSNSSSGKLVDKKKMTPLEFKRFQEKLKENRRRKEKQLKLVFGAVMLLIIIIIFYFLFYFKY